MVVYFIYGSVCMLYFLGSSTGKKSSCDTGGLGWEDQGHGTSLQYSCLENPHGQRSLAGCDPWGRKVSGMTEQLSTA